MARSSAFNLLDSSTVVLLTVHTVVQNSPTSLMMALTEGRLDQHSLRLSREGWPG